MIELKIRQNRVGPVRGRHPWVFSGAIVHILDGIESGTPVKLVDERGVFLAQGYFNSYSQIAVRVWSWDESEEINAEFFEKRILQAYEIRKNYVESKTTNSYRLINSENDLLPGLIVDKYVDYLSLQFHTRGMEFWKEEILKVLVKIVKPKGIFERSDVGNRAKENSLNPADSSNVGLLFGKVPEKIKITENGLKFMVDVMGGQKTGFFLDQRNKREALKKYVKGKKVLNCFSYTGGFSVYALEGGAKKVTSVDVSQVALDLAEENVKLNGYKNHESLCADVKGYLANFLATSVIPAKAGIQGGKNVDSGFRRNDNENFDVIVLDPPAFIKDRHKIREGIMGYRKINEMAMKLLPPGGILVTASCSTHLSLPDFRYMLSESAGRAGRTLQILETFTHGIDHPELVAFTEGEYLKCVFGVIN